MLFQLLFDILDPEDIVLCLLSLLHRADLSVAELWSVNYTQDHFKTIILKQTAHKSFIINSCRLLQAASADRDGAFTVGPTPGKGGR